MKKMLPTSAALAVVGALQLVTTPAKANEAHEARVLYQKGNVAFSNGDSILARDYYRKSLAKQEAFDTLCNLGRAEAQDKLFKEAYEHLAYCVALYPVDPELADAREKFVSLKNEVRLRLASDVLDSIDSKVEADMAERAERERVLAEGPKSGLEAEPDASAESEPQMERVKWKLPLVLSLAGAGVASGVFGGVMLGISGGQKREAEDLGEGEELDACPSASTSDDCQELYDSFKRADSAKNLGVGFVIGGGASLVSSLALYFIVPNEREVKPKSGLRFETPIVGAGHQGVSLSLGGSF